MDESTIENHSRIFLVNGWEYYNDCLLDPEDFTSNTPPIPTGYIFIGGLNGFESSEKSNFPHGKATYRLTIKIPDELKNYTLEVPKIFSAYRLYINGELKTQMGNPYKESYWPQTGNQLVNIEARNHIEIIFSVADYSHFYSGLVYPPSFGNSKDVTTLVDERLFLRTALCTITLTISFLSILFGFLSNKKTFPVLYSLLCIALIGYSLYPIAATFFNNMQPVYILEKFSFCIMLLIVLMLIRNIYNMKDKWSRIPLIFGFIMCVFSLVLPLLISSGHLGGMHFYSILISVYQWMVALFITGTTIHYFSRNIFPAKVLILAILVFDCALIMDRLLPLYEPIISGWFIELTSFILVIAIGIVICQKVAAQYNEAAVLNERAINMEQLYETQKTYFTLLKEEMEEIRKIRHDIHHHYTMIDGFIKNQQYDNLSNYISTWQPCFTNEQIKEYCNLDVINILSYHFDYIAQKNKIDLKIRCNVTIDKEKNINISDTDLCSLYSNLMENAMEACLRIKNNKRFIKVAIVCIFTNSLMIRI